MNTREIVNELKNNLAAVIKGKDEIISIFVCAFVTGGHVLLEDIPGVGKTTLVKALAKLIQKKSPSGEYIPTEFKRLQCTPDLLPYDITGVDIFNAQKQNFEFLEGPVFCDIFLADELNRTPPKVQAALLEVMEEKQVSIGRNTHKLSDLFFTAATQNPVETLGTYPLPAAELDRFMVSISLGYPDDESAMEILTTNPSVNTLENLKPVVYAEDIFLSRQEQQQVYCHPELKKALINICNATRQHPDIAIGVSPRASLQFLQLAKTVALSNNRDWVEDADFTKIAQSVFTHKCIFKKHSIDSKEIILEITNNVLLKMNRDVNWSNQKY